MKRPSKSKPQICFLGRRACRCVSTTTCSFWIGRTRSSDTATASATETTADDEALTCSISLDEITLEAPHVSMGCSHKFHGQCLVDPLIRDVRCPMLRFHPHASEFDADNEEKVKEPRVSFKEALKRAREREPEEEYPHASHDRQVEEQEDEGPCQAARDCGYNTVG